MRLQNVYFFWQNLNSIVTITLIMASPIEPTPTLYGKDAVNFLKKMLAEEKKPNPKRVKFIKEAMATKFNFVD